MPWVFWSAASKCSTRSCRATSPAQACSRNACRSAANVLSREAANSDSSIIAPAPNPPGRPDSHGPRASRLSVSRESAGPGLPVPVALGRARRGRCRRRIGRGRPTRGSSRRTNLSGPCSPDRMSQSPWSPSRSMLRSRLTASRLQTSHRRAALPGRDTRLSGPVPASHAAMTDRACHLSMRREGTEHVRLDTIFLGGWRRPSRRTARRGRTARPGRR